MRSLDCVKCGQKAAWVTVWVNLGGMIFKGVIGYLGGSKALLADAVHSGADAVVGLVTVASLKISGEAADENHPYGHGKVEFIAAALVTAALLGAVIFLFIEAIAAIHSGVRTRPLLVTLFAAVIAMITSEMLYRYNLCAGKNINSPALVANAWHNRYDVYTSAVVALGIIGAKLGIPHLDPLAAIGVGIIIVKVAVEIFTDAYNGLMDSSLPEEERSRIMSVVKRANGYTDIAYLKTRRAGQKIWIDLGIRMAPESSVSQSYQVCESIRERLFLKLENVGEVQVVVVPGKDECDD